MGGGAEETRPSEPGTGSDGPARTDETQSGNDSLRGSIAEAITEFRQAFRDVAGRQNGQPYDDPLEVFGPGEVSEAVRDHPTREAVLADLKAAFEGDLQFAAPPDEEALERQFFDFTYLEDHAEIERYWVNEPYAYVSVLEDHEENELRYRVTEPVLTEFESYVLDELTKILRNSLMYQDISDQTDKEEMFTSRARELIDKHTAAIRPISIHKLLYYLRRDFVHYDRIDPIMRDANIEDISCDGTGVPVFVYHTEYRDLDTNVRFEDQQKLYSFVTRMAQRSGKHLSVSNPLVDASLPDGSRVQLTFGGDVATRGPNFTIRQFSSVPDTPVDLINWDTFSIDQMAYFWLAIENNRSLLFAGGTGSGKTTSLNAVSFFIPKKSKIVTIEDTREITLPHDNWIQSLTRESVSGDERGQVTMYQQLQTALRQRPEYILVGEIRTESQVALTFFQAMATGHTAYTTVHSESVMGVINRLENEPLGVPTQMIKELDIISIQRQVMLGDERVRRNDRVAELLSGGDTSDIRVNDTFKWDASNDTYNTQFDSQVFDDIAADRGWDTKQLNLEYRRRKQVLEYLVENDITWWEDVARTIHTFMNDQDRVMSAIENDALEPSNLKPDDQ